MRKLRDVPVVTLLVILAACGSAHARVAPIAGSPEHRVCESIRRLLSGEPGKAYALRTGRAALEEMIDPERTIARVVLNGLAGHPGPYYEKSAARMLVDCGFSNRPTLPI